MARAHSFSMGNSSSLTAKAVLKPWTFRTYQSNRIRSLCIELGPAFQALQNLEVLSDNDQ